MGGGRGTYRFRQRIPRPANAGAGRLPAWSFLAREMRASMPLDRFREVADAAAFGLGLDGSALVHPGGDDAAAFSVLVPIFPLEGEATVLLIRRSPSLRRDAGHIAFPGGRVEHGERSIEAALREAHEEIGLDAAQISGLRRLPAVERPGGERIAAFLGVLEERPTLQINTSEVDAVVTVPLVTLLADGVGWQERWPFGAEERSVHFFADPDVLGDDLVWGLTAGILWSLLEWAVSIDGAVAGDSGGPHAAPGLGV